MFAASAKKLPRIQRSKAVKIKSNCHWAAMCDVIEGLSFSSNILNVLNYFNF
jgi:hypothetical protein